MGASLGLLSIFLIVDLLVEILAEPLVPHGVLAASGMCIAVASDCEASRAVLLLEAFRAEMSLHGLVACEDGVVASYEVAFRLLEVDGPVRGEI